MDGRWGRDRKGEDGDIRRGGKGEEKEKGQEREEV